MPFSISNLLGTINVLEYCRRSSAGLILLSTSRVYSIPALGSLPLSTVGNRFAPDAARILPIGISSEGISESLSTAAPISLYGATKLSSEILAPRNGIKEPLAGYIIERSRAAAATNSTGSIAQSTNLFVHENNLSLSLVSGSDRCRLASGHAGGSHVRS